MGRTRCIVLNVDGVPVRARVSGKLTERDLEAIREVARAAKRMTPEQVAEAVRRTREEGWLR